MEKDVYKRQDKRITIRLNGEEHELLLEYTKNHNMTMTPVSYTHLDVYKRQEVCCPALLF